MSYNLHPIFVHFPIAMLLVYSVIKILPLKKWFPKFAWRDIERVLLMVGVIGAFAALATGDTAVHLVHPNRQLVEAHENFADIATWLYGALLLGEVAAFINERLSGRNKIFQFIERILCNRTFSFVLALLALVAITLTGLLGGIIVYGKTADPFAQIILNWLGINI